MSLGDPFQDAVSLETQPAFSDSPEFDQLSEEISNGMFDINSQLTKLRRLISSLSSAKDTQHEASSLLMTQAARSKTVDINDKALKVSQDLTHSFKQLSQNMKDLQDWADVTPAQKFTQQKLGREFSLCLEEFQSLQRTLAEEQKSDVQEAKSLIESQTRRRGSSGAAELLDESQGLQEERRDSVEQTMQLIPESELTEEEMRYQQQLIYEREAEIQNIERGITELNEIFTDLGSIVTEQGTVLDNIEANIYNYATNTKGAADELTKASNYQKRSKGKMFCFLMILVAILVAVILTLIFA